MAKIYAITRQDAEYLMMAPAYSGGFVMRCDDPHWERIMKRNLQNIDAGRRCYLSTMSGVDGAVEVDEAVVNRMVEEYLAVPYTGGRHPAIDEAMAERDEWVTRLRDWAQRRE